MIIESSDRYNYKDVTLSILELKALYNLLNEVPEGMLTYERIRDKVGVLILEESMDVFDNTDEFF
jgi:GTP-sensing pleiotropic transcriptional regulator CodY